MRVLCIASGGGHLEQMLSCVGALEGHEAYLAHYDYGTFHKFKPPCFKRGFPVFFWADGGIRLLLATLITIPQWIWILMQVRPHALFSTGSELAIVPFWVGKILFRARCVFVESATRQDSPSLTGRCLYPVVDALFVQSPALLPHYGSKARFEGSLV